MLASRRAEPRPGQEFLEDDIAWPAMGFEWVVATQFSPPFYCTAGRSEGTWAPCLRCEKDTMFRCNSHKPFLRFRTSHFFGNKRKTRDDAQTEPLGCEHGALVDDWVCMSFRAKNGLTQWDASFFIKAYPAANHGQSKCLGRDNEFVNIYCSTISNTNNAPPIVKNYFPVV